MRTPQPRTNPARTPHAWLANPANEPRKVPPMGRLGDFAGFVVRGWSSPKVFAGFGGANG
jgi:hypothetical protein